MAGLNLGPNIPNLERPDCQELSTFGDSVRHALDRGSSLCEWLVQALVLASAFVACERGQEGQCGQPSRE